MTTQKSQTTKGPIGESKVCRACLLAKPIGTFYVDRAATEGTSARCKPCINGGMKVVIRLPKKPSTKPRQTRAETSFKYEKTKPGFLVRAYRNMLSRVTGVQKKKAYLYLGLPIMDKLLFYVWAQNDTRFHELFETWEKSGYDRKLTPSVDRIDSSKGYMPGNVQWLTHSQNSAKASQ